MFIKKIIFSLFFLLALGLLVYFSTPFWQNYNLIFSFSINDLFTIINLVGFILLTGLFFVIFVCLAQNYKIILPVIISSAIIPFLLTSPNISYILAIGFVICFSLIFILLNADLKSYLTFSPTKILVPQIRNTVTILTLILSLAYFYTINQEIATDGFHIPNQLIDTALTLSGQTNYQSSKPFSVNQSTLDQLKSNPDLLKQYGLDPSILDQINPSDFNQVVTNPISNDEIKKQLRLKFEEIIKPYIKYMPFLLAFLFFTTLSFISSILSLLLYPIIWFIFWLLDKSGFNKYEMEMREVKKLVV